MQVPPLKTFNAIPPGAIKNGAAFTSYVLDIAEQMPQGAKAMLWLINLGSIDAEMITCQVQESATKSTATALGGTPSVVKALTSMPDTDDDNDLIGILVPLDAARERYQQLSVKSGTGASGTYLSAECLILGVGDYDGLATSMGLAQLAKA